MSIKITECPRDAMQGLAEWIPTVDKVRYLNQLLKVGFDTLDFGSFVSPKAIPQLKDTKDVLNKLNAENTRTKLLAITANARGASEACDYDAISIIGYPFSISETFQRRNTNSSIDESLSRVEDIAAIANKTKKTLLIYISMAFGNPYGDAWNTDLACHWVDQLNSKIDIFHFAMADTIGIGNEGSISELFNTVTSEFPHLKIGAHLHSHPADSVKKLKAAYDSGCRNFDVAVNGLGGCPMAEDELVGNISTQSLFSAVEQSEYVHIDQTEFEKSTRLAAEIFP